MLFSRAVSFVTFLLASGSLTLAAPTASAALVPVGSGSSVVDVNNVLHTLQGDYGGGLPQISTVGSGISSVSAGISSGNNVATVASVEPLISQLIAVIDTATTTISLSGSATAAVDVTATVDLLLTIVLEIVSALVTLVANVTGDVSVLLASIDVALSNLVVNVGASLNLSGSILSSASIDVSELTSVLTSLSLTETLVALAIRI